MSDDPDAGPRATRSARASDRSVGEALGRVLVGGRRRVASTVYGTLVVLTTVSVGYAAERHDAANLVEVVITVVVIIWAAYVYAHALSVSIETGRPLGRDDLARVASDEVGILLAAAMPIIALLAGAVGLVSESVSVWAALVVGLVALSAQAYSSARVACAGPYRTASMLTFSIGLGLCIVALKVILVH